MQPKLPTAAKAAIVAPLCAAFMMSEFFRISHAIIAPDLMRDLAISVKGLSLLSGSFFLAFALVQIPNGIVLDRFGPRRMIPGMLIIAFVGALVFATAQSLTGLTVGRTLMGAGWAIVFMGSLVVLARWYPDHRFATMVAIFIAFGGLGNLIATVPLAAAIDVIGWRWAIVSMAAMSVVVALAIALMVRDAPPGHPYLRRDPEDLRAVLGGVREALSNRQLPYLFAINFVNYASVISVFAVLGPPYLHDVHGLGTAGRGQVLMAMSVATIVGSLCYGMLDRLFDTRKGIVAVGALGTVAIHAILALVPGLALWHVTVLFAALAGIGSYGVVNLAHARAIFPDRLVGRGIVTMAIAAFGGAAFMQFAVGVIIDMFPTTDGVAPELAYRSAFAFIAGTVVLAVIYHRRAEDAKPSLHGVRSE